MPVTYLKFFNSFSDFFFFFFHSYTEISVAIVAIIQFEFLPLVEAVQLLLFLGW